MDKVHAMNTPASTPTRPLVPCAADFAVAVIAATVFIASLLALRNTTELALPLARPLTTSAPDLVFANRVLVGSVIVSALLLAHALARLVQRLYQILNRS
jgi:hypothetical protein